MIMANPVWCCLQSGPLAVRVITPLIGVITPVTHLFSAIYRGPITPFITRGTSCRWFHPDPWGNDPIWRSYWLFNWVETHQLDSLFAKVADLSPRHLRKQSHRWYLVPMDLNIKYWFPGFGGLIQGQIYNPLHFFFGPRIVTIALHIGRPMAFPAPVASAAQDLLHVTGGRYVTAGGWAKAGRRFGGVKLKVWYCWWKKSQTTTWDV